MTGSSPQATLLPDGKRLHLHHGPVDLIIGVSDDQRAASFRRATERFQTVLSGLVQELPMLRQPAREGCVVMDPIAQRMQRAVHPYNEVFVTPMAAVAGAVADEVLAAVLAGQTPQKAYVNNGGDIAFHLSPGQIFTVHGPAGPISLDAEHHARGVATSGWRGRSHSLGIADAVTVVASTAAAADVAATLIANAIDLPGHPLVRRRPAAELSPDSDLGTRAITTHVGALQPTCIARALRCGLARAEQFRARGLIDGCVMALQGQTRLLSDSPHSHLTGDLTHA